VTIGSLFAALVGDREVEELRRRHAPPAPPDLAAVTSAAGRLSIPRSRVADLRDGAGHRPRAAPGVGGPGRPPPTRGARRAGRPL